MLIFLAPLEKFVLPLPKAEIFAPIFKGGLPLSATLC